MADFKLKTFLSYKRCSAASRIMSEALDYNYAPFDIYHVLSLDWWLHHLASAYRENPWHMLTELGLIILVLWLVFKEDQRKKPTTTDKLNVREQEELIREWQPEPLVPESISKQFGSNSHDDAAPTNFHPTIGVSSVVSDDKKEYICLSSHNYLGMATNKEVLEASERTIKEYAVGSCGPRGFYGTMDIHLNLERALSDYFGNPAIIYADYVGCPASVITAFSKRGDLLLMYVNVSLNFMIYISRYLFPSEILKCFCP